MLYPSGIKNQHKISFLELLTLIAIMSVFMVTPIPQSISYHNFADKRIIFDVPNFANVASNLPFVIIGIAGLFSLKKSSVKTSLRHIYGMLFTGIILTGLGSAYYHYYPDNNTLVYDRIPMTIVFMSLLCATVAEMIDVRMGYRMLLPLLLVGIGSVLYWHYTELKGRGDLRLYGLVQFYPMLFIPLILILFPSPANRGIRQLVWVVAWYVIAKICEHFDLAIYSASHSISGHSFKHLAAAMATWYLVKLFREKHIDFGHHPQAPE